MSTAIAELARATADAATAYTEAVMDGPPPGPAGESSAYRTAAAETERSAHAELADAGGLPQLDAEMAAAETEPEVTGPAAEAARAQARADLEAWLAEPEAG
jgi:hypothetical protein